jgi:hypothetical protein
MSHLTISKNLTIKLHNQDWIIFAINLAFGISSIESKIEKLEGRIFSLENSSKNDITLVKCKENIQQVMSLVGELEDLLHNSVRFQISNKISKKLQI